MYDDTKGWGVDLWEDIKKGSKKAANSTKEALNSLAEKDDDTKKVKEDKIETTALDPDTVKDGQKEPMITPAPLKSSEKKAQPPVTKTSVTYAVHLSSNKSKASAKKEWAELKNAFPKETDGLSLKLKPVKIIGKGTFYRVLGASFKNKTEANKACEAFKKKKQYCLSIKL
ncbi:SPOR domain-containing protein [Kiloniella sp. EL199]|uniref:SPOR domain-containing protein n=1 Tax=Kiloniella sp. EL199 TaxID=2107581 RepID=UPI0013C3F31D|nr:SPOR domain-containing protein [Kiloniella sp. EL199]